MGSLFSKSGKQKDKKSNGISSAQTENAKSTNLKMTKPKHEFKILSSKEINNSRSKAYSFLTF